MTFGCLEGITKRAMLNLPEKFIPASIKVVQLVPDDSFTWHNQLLKRPVQVKIEIEFE